MKLRILHTADNHIGLSFSSYPESVRTQLIDERFAALQRLVATANERDADFFVVAGDLFDRVRVTKAEIDRTVKILAQFTGVAVLVLAGNHDYCEGADSTIWKTFRKSSDGTNILALTECEARDFDGDDFKVRFYACPCPSKHSPDSMIGWVTDAEKAANSLHIGLAHGNVEGLGLDADQRYFNMTEENLKKSGVHTWLLGHIHVPSPAAGTVGKPIYFMPGIHTPDSVKCSHPGHAWWIEFDETGVARHEQLTSGGIRFTRISRSLQHANDIVHLRAECEAMLAPTTVLDLQLTGRLFTEDLSDLHALLADLAPGFLYRSYELDIAKMLNATDIARQYPDGTLPHALLEALLEDSSNPGDAQLALDILQTLNQE